MAAIVRWVLGALVLALPVSALAQQQGTDQATALASQIQNAYAVSPTEADFIEVEFPPHASGLQVYRGHATFTDIGFVLAYSLPLSRVVVSDLHVTRTVDKATHAHTEERAERSKYAPLLALTGTRRLALTTCFGPPTNVTTYRCSTSDYSPVFLIDAKTARVSQIRAGFHPNIAFTNIHAIAQARALPIVTAAMLVK